MDAPQADPNWIDFLKYTLSAAVASVATGRPWTDPKTGTFSTQQGVQAIATWFLFGLGTAAAQEHYHQPFWITALFAATLALVGLPLITAAVQSGFALFLKARFGISDGGNGSDRKF